jgi:U3 small nucleolar RNA-associated protein MPP10
LFLSGSENEAPAPAPVKVVPKKPLTKHEKAKAHLSSQVAELEQELMQKKSWEMRGEVKATDRPENSLLGISADIERSSKPAPVISQEFTTSLEDMILKRVNEDRFDDVQPKKERDSRNVAASGEAPELSQEKNRQGLGEIYAEEFLAKSLNSQPEVVSKKLDAARQEALGLYQKISMQLDGLSHFYFTPRAVVADAAITTLATKTALSSLELEDILPGMESSASQFAPGQVLEKRKGRDASLMSKEELTSDDRKRLRRARKNARSDSEDSDAEQKGGKAGRKQQRAKDDKHLDDELRRDKRVTLNGKSSKHGGGTNGDENQNGEYSKSASFFEKLQQNAQSEISGVGKGEKKSKKKVVENGSGSSYKL